MPRDRALQKQQQHQPIGRTQGQDQLRVTRTRLVPPRPQSELEAERGRASVVVLKELGTNLFPRHGRGWVLLMGIKAGLKLLKLDRHKGRCLRVLGRNTVPNVLGKLDSLGHGEVEEVGFGLVHVGSIDR